MGDGVVPHEAIIHEGPDKDAVHFDEEPDEAVREVQIREADALNEKWKVLTLQQGSTAYFEQREQFARTHADPVRSSCLNHTSSGRTRPRG